MDIRKYFTHTDADGQPRPETQQEAIARLGEERVSAMYKALWKAAEKLPAFGSLCAESIVKDPANYGIYATIANEIAEQCNTAREIEIRELQKQYPKLSYGQLSWRYCSLPKYYLEPGYGRLTKMIDVRPLRCRDV